jgi:hypothetical protein
VDDERAALDLLLRGFQISRMLRLVAELGIADRIAPDGQIAIEALATACNALRWPPKTGQVAKRESQLGMAVWPKVRHGKYTEEAQS